MRLSFFSLSILLTLAPTAFGHVGSPNVFFEGKAGDYGIYVVVRPPAALPGIAQVSVRVNANDVHAVSLTPVMYQTGKQGSPEPTPAEPVAGEQNLWAAPVWFLRPGSYSLQVAIKGTVGQGEAIVPVNVLGTGQKGMGTTLAVSLACCWALLLTFAALLIHGAAHNIRERNLESAKTHITSRIYARRATAIGLLLLCSGAAALAHRWQQMDEVYRSTGLQKPQPVAAAEISDSKREVLQLNQVIGKAPPISWEALVPDHGKLMHLFLLREPGWDVFAHMHPRRQDALSFAAELPSLPAGDYCLYGEITFETGFNQTLVSRVTLPEPVGAPLGLPPVRPLSPGDVICGWVSAPANDSAALVQDPDDSWWEGIDWGGASAPSPQSCSTEFLVSRLPEGYSVVFENAGRVSAGQEPTLRFTAFAPDGTKATLEPYMGMKGHLALRLMDGSVFAHLHPAGSFSMASQEVFKQRDSSGLTTTQNDAAKSSSEVPPNVVSFPYQFPKPGLYRLWLQIRVGGRVLTAAYDLSVKTSW